MLHAGRLAGIAPITRPERLEDTPIPVAMKKQPGRRQAGARDIAG